MIKLSQETVNGLNKIGLRLFGTKCAPSFMAFDVLILARLSDRPEWFPKGKWATIQEIQRQLNDVADEMANEINASKSNKDTVL